MRAYELMYIVRPDLDEETVKSLKERVLSIINTNGGQVEKTDSMGKRRLAYDIKGYSEGIYEVVQFQAEPTLIKELERQLGINDQVIRHLVVREDD